ncbi:predicted protein [Nematostella vectensis]|uniref:MAD2L1-binding protein n=1 Tax=Nematostella vectensis TaxID=45351 RepID=A7RJ75_NEMVE|nr:predicted protein [Nematostella vectensis]|eukprot:XP_001640594.1 predicted protein [Nematostella vectensis]
MAATDSSEFDIKFSLEENDSREVKAQLLIVFIKHLLHDRFQVPCTIDQIRSEAEEESSKAGQTKKTGLSTDITKKRDKIITDLDILFKNLEELFATADVASVVVIYGSTAVSPKESYILQFDANSSNSFTLSSSNKENLCSSGLTNRLCRKLIRALISNPVLSKFQEIPLTPMLVFVSVPRTVKNYWFRPKPSFKVPWRGNRFRISVSSSSVQDLPSQSSDQDELIWMQAPITIKGFRLKVKEENSSSHFWS